MTNKVIEILESSERINAEINRIVNKFRVYKQDAIANDMRDRLKKLVQMVRHDMIEIHKLDSTPKQKEAGV